MVKEMWIPSPRYLPPETVLNYTAYISELIKLQVQNTSFKITVKSNINAVMGYSRKKQGVVDM